MRWSDLFDDLEAQVTRAEREAFEDEVKERSDAEKAAVELGAVLAASEGARVRITLMDGTAIAGEVIDCAAQWLHITEGPREWLVPAWAIAELEGAGTGAAQPGLIAARLTLGHALRALAADGSEVVVHARSGHTRGRITAVGANYLVFDAGRIIPFAAILTVVPAP